MAHHPSQDGFDPRDTLDGVCQFCPEVVWSRIIVPASVHPDQQLFVCEAHGDFIESVGLTIEAICNPSPFDD